MLVEAASSVVGFSAGADLVSPDAGVATDADGDPKVGDGEV